MKITSTSACNAPSAGNFCAQVLVNAYTDLPIRGKYIPLTKNNENTIKLNVMYRCNFIS